VFVQQLQKKTCKWKNVTPSCKNKVCCTSRYRAGSRIFHNCFVQRKKCKRIQKRTCWNRKTKNLKRGKCITRSCCIQRLIHKKLKTIRKSCFRRTKCSKGRFNVHTRCHFRLTKNNCRRRICCRNTYLNGMIRSSKCRRGTLTCPIKIFKKCRWIQSKHNCYKRRCCTGLYKLGNIINKKCLITRKRCYEVKKRVCKWKKEGLCKRRRCCIINKKGGKIIKKRCKNLWKSCPRIFKTLCNKVPSKNKNCTRFSCCKNRFSFKQNKNIVIKSSCRTRNVCKENDITIKKKDVEMN